MEMTKRIMVGSVPVGNAVRHLNKRFGDDSLLLCGLPRRAYVLHLYRPLSLHFNQIDRAVHPTLEDTSNGVTKERSGGSV